MSISLRTIVLVALALAVGAAGAVLLGGSSGGSPATAAAPVKAPSQAAAPRPVPEVPIAEVGGSTPGTRLSLLALSRTGPKVVTARVRIGFVSSDPEVQSAWLPSLIEDGLSAEDMRLVDEVNGREHFVLRNSDGACLCTGPFPVVDSGDSIEISAKFPAPPGDVERVSLETPGFPSFDAVPLS